MMTTCQRLWLLFAKDSFSLQGRLCHVSLHESSWGETMEETEQDKSAVHHDALSCALEALQLLVSLVCATTWFQVIDTIVPNMIARMTSPAL